MTIPMTMPGDDPTCRDVAALLMAYLDRELDPARRAALEAHLAACDDCVRYLRAYERTVRLARAAGREPDPPEAIPESLVRAIVAAARKP